jgi:aminoglycoside phosphotransferase (APT) family kinase protein
MPQTHDEHHEFLVLNPAQEAIVPNPIAPGSP